MVETRSGLSVEPPEEAEGATSASQRQKDTAGTTAAPTTPVAARMGVRGRSPRRGWEPGATEPSQVLSDSQAYTLLALALGLIALSPILVPKLAAHAAFGSAADPPEEQHTHTLGLLACGLMAAASTTFALEECARKHMLHTFTADTLKLGLAAFAAGNLLLLLHFPRTLTPAAAILSALSQAATLALPASQLFVTGEDRGRVWRNFRRLPHNLRRAVWLRKATLPGALYLLLTAAFPALGLAYSLAPSYTLYHALGYVYGKSTLMVWKVVGCGLLTVLPALTYNLKDKAENDLLARSVSRTLNLGLMASSIGHLLIFGPILNQGHGGVLLPPLVTTWAVALLASMAGLAAPETAAFAESLVEAARTE